MPNDRPPVETDPLVVYAGTRRFRRWHTAFVALIVVWLGVTLALGSWLNVASAALLVVSQGFVASNIQARVHLDDDGIVLDDRWRRERVAWHDVAEVQLRWKRGVMVRRPTLPAVVRRDGTTVWRSMLAHLGESHRRAEREALLARLQQAAETHGFHLDVQEPKREIP